jgi:hypothetical protein
MDVLEKLIKYDELNANERKDLRNNVNYLRLDKQKLKELPESIGYDETANVYKILCSNQTPHNLSNGGKKTRKRKFKNMKQKSKKSKKNKK